jgi:polyisoprenoid-binding protein YceI
MDRPARALLLLPALILALAGCGAAPPSPAPAPAMPAAGERTYRIDPKHTFASFEVRHLGYSTHRGRFDKSAGTLTFDPAGRTGTIDLTIEADSIDTGDRALEEQLRASSWLDVAEHPQIRYRARRLRFDGDRLAAVDGELTIRGITRPVVLTVTAYRCGVRRILVITQDACGADAEARIKRSDFGMIAFPTMVGDDVRILIQAEAIRQ